MAVTIGAYGTIAHGTATVSTKWISPSLHTLDAGTDKIIVFAARGFDSDAANVSFISWNNQNFSFWSGMSIIQPSNTGLDLWYLDNPPGGAGADDYIWIGVSVNGVMRVGAQSINLIGSAADLDSDWSSAQGSASGATCAINAPSGSLVLSCLHWGDDYPAGTATITEGAAQSLVTDIPTFGNRTLLASSGNAVGGASLTTHEYYTSNSRSHVMLIASVSPAAAAGEGGSGPIKSNVKPFTAIQRASTW